MWPHRREIASSNCHDAPAYEVKENNLGNV